MGDPHEEFESVEDLLNRRFEQIRAGVTEAIRREVEFLRKHRFPVWICDENGDVVDATKIDRKNQDEEG